MKYDYMSEVTNIDAGEIPDSCGSPTIEADVITADDARGSAMLSSGASTGSRKALELCNGDKVRYPGRYAFPKFRD